MKSIGTLCTLVLAAANADLSNAEEAFQIEETTIALIQQAFRDQSLTCHLTARRTPARRRPRRSPPL
jgi:hypothetical protein